MSAIIGIAAFAGIPVLLFTATYLGSRFLAWTQKPPMVESHIGVALWIGLGVPTAIGVAVSCIHLAFAGLHSFGAFP